MDIIAPQLIWINGRCYRVNPTREIIQQYHQDPKEQQESKSIHYVEEDLYDEDNSDEEDCDIIMEKNRYKTSFHVPQVFFAQIIGSKGMTKRRIEAETKTQIFIPKQGVDGDIIITGLNRKDIIQAKRKINLIVLSARNKQQFTHFLCVPFTNSEIQENYKKFKDDILNKKTELGLSNIESSIFQSPYKLHLTIATLSLMDNNDRLLAVEVLQECKESVIDPILLQYGAIELQLKDLEYMNDDPSSVDVLYGKIESEPMQLIADGIADRFIKKGLMHKKTDKIKLHVTLMNSLFLEEYFPIEPSNFSMMRDRKKFDARRILENYKNYEFGTQPLQEIHLSQRYSTANDGFYEATGTLLL